MDGGYGSKERRNFDRGVSIVEGRVFTIHTPPAVVRGRPLDLAPVVGKISRYVNPRLSSVDARLRFNTSGQSCSPGNGM